MAATMQAKFDSEVTYSADGAGSSPPRSPRRQLYYVQSPCNHEYGAPPDKMSYRSSPPGSPAVNTHHNGSHHTFGHYYRSSPIDHSRESSTSRFSASLLNPRYTSSSSAAWKKLQGGDGGDADDDPYEETWHRLRLCVGFVVLSILVFAAFSLILWGASRGHPPVIVVQNVVFERFDIQAGVDQSGVPTDMLTLNSTVRIFYRNTATFFGVHVTSAPLQLHYLQLRLASGHMKKFYQSRKSQSTVVTAVAGHQVPLYGGVSVLSSAGEHPEAVAVPMNLTFVMRSRAHILGKLVRSKFDRLIRCSVTLRGNELGKPLDLTNLCIYR